MGEAAATRFLESTGSGHLGQEFEPGGGRRIYDLTAQVHGRRVCYEVKVNGARVGRSQARYDRGARMNGVVVRYIHISINRNSGRVYSVARAGQW